MPTGVTQNRLDNGLAFCTIISKNYLAHARALYQSIQATNPACSFTVLLADRAEGYFDPTAERFPIVAIEDLPIPDLPGFCFQYNLLELNTAAKPFFMQFLMEQRGAKKLVYLDPDILVFDNLRSLSELLDRYPIILTPHLTSPLTADRCTEQEIGILRAGVYNLGFAALAAAPTTKRFLQWWAERLRRHCLLQQANGLMVDQKWIDLVPGMFEGVHILTEPGYNVAYWNIVQRQVTFDGGCLRVNGRPGYFFHFSGFNPRRANLISKYSKEGLTLDDVGEARRLYRDYAEKLRQNGYRECMAWPYAYGRFDNGVAISDPVRRLYWDLGDKARMFGNPFCAQPPHSYFHWLAGQPRLLPPYAKLFNPLPRLGTDLSVALRKTAGAFYRAIRGRLSHCEKLRSFVDEIQINLNYRRQARAFRKLRGSVGNSSQGCSINGKHILPAVFSGAPASERPFGVNLAGYFQSEKGVGEAARAVIRALRAAQIPFVLNNVRDSGSLNRDVSAGDVEKSNPYAFNLVQLNADQATAFARSHPKYFRGHHNIGYWNWELMEFPLEWRDSFSFFDEVWTPSSFTQKAVSSIAPVPVRWVPFAVSQPEPTPPGVGRGRFGLGPDVFVFLFAFDFMSFLERKNPLAVVAAFRRAFGNRKDVHLVLKTMHGSSCPADRERLRSACQGNTNITILDEVLGRPEMQVLMSVCNAYVSLHRCEGFGLTLAEAMAMGKAVITSLYSANADFMDASNCCPIRYRLAKIRSDHGPYRRGQVWAEPQIEHAAEWMKRLVDDPKAAARIGQQARRDVTENLSPQRIGNRIASLLTALGERKAGRSMPAKAIAMA